MFFVFGREEKSLEIVQVESKQPGSLFFFLFFVFFFFFLGLEVLGAFYSPSTDYEVVDLQGPPPSKGVGLDSS